MSEYICPHCGSILPEAGKFCGICGAPLLQEESAPRLSGNTITPPDAPSSVTEPENPPAAPEAVVEVISEKEIPAEPNTPTSVTEKMPHASKWAPRGAMRTILAVLLCFLIFILSFTALSLFTFRTAIASSQCESTIQSALYNMDVTKIPASTVFTNLEDKDISLSDWFINIAAEVNPEFEDISSQEFREYWEKSIIPQQLADILSQNLHSIYFNDPVPEITKDDLAYVLKEDSRNIRKAFGIELTESELNEIASLVAGYDFLDQLHINTVKLRSPATICTLQICASVWILAILGFLILREILILLKVNRSILRTCGDTGITLMVMGGIWVIAGLWIAFLPNTWLSAFAKMQPVGAVLGEFISRGLLYAGILFGAGLILLLIRIIGKKIVVKSEKIQV